MLHRWRLRGDFFAARNHDQPTVGNCKTAGDISSPVVSNFGFRWNANIFVDNHTVQSTAAANIDALEQDAVLNMCVAIDANVWPQDAASYGATANDGTLAYQ